MTLCHVYACVYACVIPTSLVQRPLLGTSTAKNRQRGGESGCEDECEGRDDGEFDLQNDPRPKERGVEGFSALAAERGVR